MGSHSYTDSRRNRRCTHVPSSPLAAASLRSINPALNRLVETQQPLHTAARKYVRRLTYTSECLRAHVAILETENHTLKNTIKVRKKGKRFALQGEGLTELHGTITECEKETREKKQSKRCLVLSPEPDSNSKDELGDGGRFPMDVITMGYCIEVTQR